VELGLTESRAKAQALIKAGNVLVDGKPAVKPGQSCFEQQKIEITGEFCPYVSRGGLKLEKALRDFGVDPTGFVCSDSGASTGGFTDCLLQQGASKVFAIDVGTDQLVGKIRNDPRVVVMEQTNIRYVTSEDLGEKLDLSVVDVSFISLSLVLPTIANLLDPEHGQVLCLIKPQFEAGREKVGKKGVVKDPVVHKEVLDRFVDLAQQLQFTILGLTYSPVRGPEGNIEFLGHLTFEEKTSFCPDTAKIVKEAHEALKV
jgi:23S rRNA (cytidine1920-2'-O)/16S rRNA (cytidine1409-2'-O)-methyltransferase